MDTNITVWRNVPTYTKQKERTVKISFNWTWEVTSLVFLSAWPFTLPLNTLNISHFSFLQRFGSHRKPTTVVFCCCWLLHTTVEVKFDSLLCLGVFNEFCPNVFNCLQISTLCLPGRAHLRKTVFSFMWVLVRGNWDPGCLMSAVMRQMHRKTAFCQFLLYSLLFTTI